MIYSLPIYTSSNEGFNYNWYQSLVKIHPWWWETKGRDVVIALLDSGIDYVHPAFTGKIVRMIDCTLAESKWSAYVDSGRGANHEFNDDTGHGTHCAGIIVGKDEHTGFTGMAQEAKLHVYRVMDKREGEWEYATRALQEILHWNNKKHSEGMQAEKVRLVNISFSGQYPTDAFYRAVHEVLASGVCIIAAAGNEGGRYQNGIGYPGKYGGVITVAAHDEFGRPSPFSSSGGEIDFMAPGTKVYSAYPNDKSKESPDYDPKESYKIMSGTSMAAPFITGLAALIIAKHSGSSTNNSPVRNNEELRRHLIRLATHPGHHDQHSGYGPLTTFQHLNINQAGEQESSISSIWIHGRQNEPSTEYDDRVDWSVLSFNDYWYKLKNSTSGAYWAGEKIEHLKRRIKRQSDCVGLMVRKGNVEKAGKGKKMLKSVPLKKNVYINGERKQEELCESVRFREQPSIMGGTGFIYAENYIVTANHLFKPSRPDSVLGEYYRYDVSDFYFILDYKSKSSEKQKYNFPQRKIFECIEAWGPQKDAGPYQDWCIIKVKGDTREFKKRINKLDEAFSESANSDFLQDRMGDKQLIPNSYLYTLGHPFGMPQKFTPDGRLLGFESEGMWKHDLDVFPGNSGSPVFSAEDFRLIGVVTRTRVNHQWQEVTKKDGSICYIHNENYHIKPSSRLQEIGSVKDAFQKIVQL